jgi:hypothetical protein
MFYHLKSTSIILCISFLSACGGGSDSTTVTPDTTAPTVSSKTPAASATAVARNSAITATFDEDMFATTVDATSFTLAKSGAVDGTVTFDAVSNVATFTPSSELAILATYTATLGTAITDLSGNSLAADYNWSFTTADGAWGAAEQIETDNAGSATNPHVAFDSSGNAIAVWSQTDGSEYSIYAKGFDGTNWGNAELIEEENAGNAFSPQVAFDGSGNAIAVWFQSDGARNNIWANRFDGTNWGDAELIEEENAGDAFSAQVAFDSSGNAIAVWFQSDGARNNIWANRFDGSSWGAAKLIETENAGDARNSQVAFDSSGNAIAVWQQNDGTLNNIYANRFVGTSWGDAELIETENAGDARIPHVAFDSSGNAIAVWQQSDGTHDSIWANRFDGSSWGDAELIETENAGDARIPQVAFDSSGNAISVWFQSDGARNNIWANRFDGSSWGAAKLIETENAGDARNPQVAFDSSGNAIAVWYQSDGSLSNIYANRFDGTNWGAAELIEIENAGDALSPQVAFDSSGNAIAVWGQYDESRSNISANRFQ